MRPPTVLDIVQAVTEVAPSHPEVAVWWYTRAGEPRVGEARVGEARANETGASLVQIVLEARGGTQPDTAHIRSALAERLGTATLSVRLHRGGEEAALYRVLTIGDTRTAAGHAGGS
jgi:hypothetical protein